MLTPLDHALFSVLLPALTGRPPPSELERKLFALPARLGGLGINMPSKTATQVFHSSQLVTSTLCEHILSQDLEYGYEVIAKQLEAKAQVRQGNHIRNSTETEELRDLLSDPLRRAVDLAKEKGSSTWLTALPLAEHALPSIKGPFMTPLH